MKIWYCFNFIFFRKVFGNIISLDNADAFLDAVDKEDKSVTIIIHIYDKVSLQF